MCVPGCLEHVHERVASRRQLFRGVAATAATAAAVSLPLVPALSAEPRSFSRVVDLTHPLGPDFPTYFGKPQIELEVMASYDKQKFNMLKWSVVEHTGTHMDAPFHFSPDGLSADRVPVDKLVVPVVVVDIARKAQDDADAQVTPDDIKAFEAQHGPIPAGACVAMRSGWERHLKEARFRNADEKGVMHFPGFHLEAAKLLQERDVAGIAVDTLSLDFGASPDFAVHYAWLPSGGRWGIECIANLGELPPTGATLVLGGPKIVGSTGGPSRVLALV